MFQKDIFVWVRDKNASCGVKLVGFLIPVWGCKSTLCPHLPSGLQNYNSLVIGYCFSDFLFSRAEWSWNSCTETIGDQLPSALTWRHHSHHWSYNCNVWNWRWYSYTRLCCWKRPVRIKSCLARNERPKISLRKFSLISIADLTSLIQFSVLKMPKI